MNIVDFGPGAQRLADLVARVEDGELGGPTPCPAYTLGDLIEHVGGLANAFTAAANKDSGEHGGRGPSGDASQLGEDWRTRIPRDLGALARAWRAPGAWAGMTRIAGTDAPARSFLVQFISPDAPAGPDVPFGPPRQLPGGAPPLDRVVALAGRDPGWSPG